jgi:hypothetical protein
MVAFTIYYVDGEVIEDSGDFWKYTRGDGVDRVVIRNESGASNFGGNSAYWLYQEDDMWVAGQASFRYSPTLPPEVLFFPDGTQKIRRIQYVPDLEHSSVKLGWWWPGTVGEPWL